MNILITFVSTCICVFVEPLDKFLLSSALPSTMAQYAEEEEEEKQDLPDESHKYEYFWRASSPFSQWYPCEFDIDGRTFNCAEQYLIYQKAGMNSFRFLFRYRNNRNNVHIYILFEMLHQKALEDSSDMYP